MLAVSGLELALVVRDQVRLPNAFVALVTAGACLGFGNVGLGFCVGLAIAWGMAAVARHRAHQEEERGRLPR
jgi:F0F1-type ATP synthase membrane subunit c/vacuolar-type H+-ATPase subunit K